MFSWPFKSTEQNVKRRENVNKAEHQIHSASSPVLHRDLRREGRGRLIYSFLTWWDLKGEKRRTLSIRRQINLAQALRKEERAERETDHEGRRGRDVFMWPGMRAVLQTHHYHLSFPWFISRTYITIHHHVSPFDIIDACVDRLRTSSVIIGTGR